MLLFNEEFEPYRQLEIQEGVQALKELSKDEFNPDCYTGAMWMLKRIINLPVKMANEESKEQMEQAEALRRSALAYFEAKMVRSFLDE